MKAYIANGILIPDEDCAIVYDNNSDVIEVPIYTYTKTIKCELLTNALEMDINIQERKANIFIHFDHPEFDPTANTELYNSIEVELSFNEGFTYNPDGEFIGKYCRSLEVETKNRNYKMEHLSYKVQEEIISCIQSAVDEYLKEQND